MDSQCEHEREEERKKNSCDLRIRAHRSNCCCDSGVYHEISSRVFPEMLVAQHKRTYNTVEGQEAMSLEQTENKKYERTSGIRIHKNRYV